MKLTRGVLGAVALVMAFAFHISADTWWSAQFPNNAPMPFNPFPELGATWLGPGQWAINDLNLDYTAIATALASAPAESGELSATATARSRGGGGFAPMFSFVPGLALEWTNVDLTNMVANLLLEGAISNNN